MVTQGLHRSRGSSNASFRRRFRPEEGTQNAAATAIASNGGGSDPRLSLRHRTNFTRSFANVLEAIGAIGFAGALVLFFRDRALALRVLIGSTVTAGVGVLINLGITVIKKLRAVKKAG